MNLLKKPDGVASAEKLMQQLKKCHSDREEKNPKKYGAAIDAEEKRIVSEFGSLLTAAGYHVRPIVLDETLGIHGARLKNSVAVCEAAQEALSAHMDDSEAIRAELLETAHHQLRDLPRRLTSKWAATPNLKFAVGEAEKMKQVVETDYTKAEKALEAWDAAHPDLARLVEMTEAYNSKEPRFKITGFTLPEAREYGPEEREAVNAVTRAGQSEARKYLAEALK